MRSSIKFSGVNKVIANMEKTIKRVQEGNETAVGNLAQLIFARSQFYVPKDTTMLEKSGDVTVSSAGNKALATITYGGGIVDYAVYVHEDLEAKHQSPTSAKFLERALIEGRAKGKPRFTADIRRALKSSI